MQPAISAHSGPLYLMIQAPHLHQTRATLLHWSLRKRLALRWPSSVAELYMRFGAALDLRLPRSGQSSGRWRGVRGLGFPTRTDGLRPSLDRWPPRSGTARAFVFLHRQPVRRVVLPLRRWRTVRVCTESTGG